MDDAFGCLLIVIFWGLKLVCLIGLIIQVCYLIVAAQHDAVGTFNFTWLVLSAAGVLLI